MYNTHLEFHSWGDDLTHLDLSAGRQNSGLCLSYRTCAPRPHHAVW